MCPAPVKQCEMDAMKGREAAIEGFSWGALAGVVLVALMYGAGSLLGLELRRLVQQVGGRYERRPAVECR